MNKVIDDRFKALRGFRRVLQAVGIIGAAVIGIGAILSGASWLNTGNVLLDAILINFLVGTVAAVIWYLIFALLSTIDCHPARIACVESSNARRSASAS